MKCHKQTVQSRDHTLQGSSLHKLKTERALVLIPVAHPLLPLPRERFPLL